MINKKSIREVLEEKGLNVNDYFDTLSKAKILAIEFGLRLHYYYVNCYGYQYVNSKLRIDIKPIINNDLKGFRTIIYYNNTTVLDSEKKEYLPGKWEEIINILYDNIDIMKLEQARKNKTINNIKTISSKMDYRNDKAVVNNSLTIIKQYQSAQDAEDNYYNLIAIYVNKNNDCVLSCNKKEYDDIFNIMKYSPGSWEEEIDEYIRLLYNNSQKKFEQENNASIDEEIKKLRKKYN